MTGTEVRIKTDGEDVIVHKGPRGGGAAQILNAVRGRRSAEIILQDRPPNYCSFCIKKNDVLVVSIDGIVAICPTCIANAAEAAADELGRLL